MATIKANPIPPELVSMPGIWLLPAEFLKVSADRLWEEANDASLQCKEMVAKAAVDAQIVVATTGFRLSAFLLYGLAIENALKAVRVRTLNDGEEDVFLASGRLNGALAHHHLLQLADDCGLGIRDHQERRLLERLESAVVWFARYPAPTNTADFGTAWDDAETRVDDHALIVKLYTAICVAARQS